MTRTEADTIPPPAIHWTSTVAGWQCSGCGETVRDLYRVPHACSPLRSDVLYMGDNGRLHCGKRSCAGATAYATGIDLHGEPCVPVGPVEILAWSAMFPEPMACETCGLTASLDPSGHVVTERPS